mmetsp:Transcript_8958/g.12443  ORF Transcript_8958/g.12443 Transcript_8958/m.12443 type:complete len:84 (-) Transcript_8958:146-397(-)
MVRELLSHSYKMHAYILPTFIFSRHYLKVLAIRKVLKASSESSSGSGDVFNVVTDLSVAFFQSLLQATRCFFELFNEQTTLCC